MELKDFIRDTVMQIMTGVQEAQQVWKGNGVINPIWDLWSADKHIQEISFDVAVTAQDEMTGGGRGGVKVVAIEFGGNAQRTTKNSTVSRISFKIPFIPPATIVKDEGTQ